MSEPAHGVPLLRNDRGIVLILTLMVIMVLSVLATAFLFLSGTEINISRNSQVVTQAFYAAEAGIDTAINQLPNTTAINQTALGVNNAVFQTGPPPPAPPAPAVALGPNPSPPAGFNLANFSFNMYQIDVSGTVLVPRSDMQLRVGATVGTPMAGTSY
jgi:type II secretory pathway pseudopilin PulG